MVTPLSLSISVSQLDNGEETLSSLVLCVGPGRPPCGMLYMKFALKVKLYNISLHPCLLWIYTFDFIIGAKNKKQNIKQTNKNPAVLLFLSSGKSIANQLVAFVALSEALE